MTDPRVLILPGWLDSPAPHWQSLWQQRCGWQRVEQDDWVWPRRGDWMARLEEVLLDDPRPAVLVAHSLGCQLVAAWAAHTQHSTRVRAALLVAPPDTECDNGTVPPQLFAWRPIVRRRLPFAALVVDSDNVPFCTPAAAVRMAADWGCERLSIGSAGHINGDSGLGEWPAGQALLQALIERSR
jgi:predicted alpha/beta hydrolase family esterase